MVVMRIIVFLHGTAIMHTAHPRDFAAYVPTEGAVAKIRAWHHRGAEITYLSSRRRPAELQVDRDVLAAHGFPPGPVVGREDGGDYRAVVRRLAADLLVEDDCQSIGGAAEIIGAVPPTSSMVIPEFAGLAHLPDDLGALLAEANAQT
jgi:hypothetical protein